MKKTFVTILMALLLCATLVFSLTSCGFTQDDMDRAANEAAAPLNGQITALEADIAQKTAKIAALETEKAALIREKETLEAEIAAIEANNGTLTAEKATLTAKVSELEASIAATETKIASLTASIATLTAEKKALTDQVAALEGKSKALESEKAALAIKINCLEGKHVVNETKTVSYAYTWSEATPTSTKKYTCLHCEKAVEEPVSPSAWRIGDQVTYTAKDGNSYASTVGEVTDEKAVLINETVNNVRYTYDKWTDEKVLALLNPVGARYPSHTEAVASRYQAATDSYVDNNNSGDLGYRYLAIYQDNSTVKYRFYASSWKYLERSYWNTSATRTATLYYCYVWDVPFVTAE